MLYPNRSDDCEKDLCEAERSIDKAGLICRALESTEPRMRTGCPTEGQVTFQKSWVGQPILQANGFVISRPSIRVWFPKSSENSCSTPASRHAPNQERVPMREHVPRPHCLSPVKYPPGRQGRPPDGSQCFHVGERVGIRISCRIELAGRPEVLARYLPQQHSILIKRGNQIDRSALLFFISRIVCVEQDVRVNRDHTCHFA